MKGTEEGEGRGLSRTASNGAAASKRGGGPAAAGNGAGHTAAGGPGPPRRLHGLPVPPHPHPAHPHRTTPPTGQARDAVFAAEAALHRLGARALVENGDAEMGRNGGRRRRRNGGLPAEASTERATRGPAGRARRPGA